MRSSCVTASLVLGLTVPVVAATPALAHERERTLTGTVVGVLDGDSIRVDLDKGPVLEVRLIGVAAPEGGACYTEEAAQYARDELSGEEVVLVIERRHEPRGDQRLFAYVYDDDLFFNLSAIELGFAEERSYGEDYELRSEFVAAEADARDDELGLWDDCQSQS